MFWAFFVSYKLVENPLAVYWKLFACETLPVDRWWIHSRRRWRRLRGQVASSPTWRSDPSKLRGRPAFSAARLSAGSLFVLACLCMYRHLEHWNTHQNRKMRIDSCSVQKKLVFLWKPDTPVGAALFERISCFEQRTFVLYSSLLSEISRPSLLGLFWFHLRTRRAEREKTEKKRIRNPFAFFCFLGNPSSAAPEKKEKREKKLVTLFFQWSTFGFSVIS